VNNKSSEEDVNVKVAVTREITGVTTRVKTRKKQLRKKELRREKAIRKIVKINKQQKEATRVARSTTNR